MGGGGACAALVGDPHVAPIVKCAPIRHPCRRMTLHPTLANPQSDPYAALVGDPHVAPIVD